MQKAIVMTEEDAQKFRFHLAALNKMFADVSFEPAAPEIPTLAPVPIPNQERPKPPTWARLTKAEKKAAADKKRKRRRLMKKLWTPERRAQQGERSRARWARSRQQPMLPLSNGNSNGTHA